MTQKGKRLHGQGYGSIYLCPEQAPTCTCLEMAALFAFPEKSTNPKRGSINFRKRTSSLSGRFIKVEAIVLRRSYIICWGWS